MRQGLVGNGHHLNSGVLHPDSRRRVLIVGGDFAPSSLPPALRIRLFCQHLPEFNWDPVVVTTDSKHYHWQVDPDNHHLLPKYLQVIRTQALPSWLSELCGLSDIGLRSIWCHWQAALQVCRKQRIDVLFIPVPPFYSMIIGRLVYEQTGIPYVVDYIDPWVSDLWRCRPGATRLSKRGLADFVARTIEPIALRKVGHITGVAKSYMTDVVNRYPWLSEADLTGIPYGAEPKDFEYVRTNPRPNRIFNPNDDLFHVSYVGRGGDDMVSSIRTLLRGFKAGLIQDPTLFGKMRIHFVGTSYAPTAPVCHILPIAEAEGLHGFVTEHPARISYLDSLQVMIDSEALLAVGSDLPYYTASKIYPYLLAERPLVAIFHHRSSVVDVLRRSRSHFLYTFDDELNLERKVASITKGLSDLLTTKNPDMVSCRSGLPPEFTARSMAGRLAEVFNEVLRM